MSTITTPGLTQSPADVQAVLSAIAALNQAVVSVKDKATNLQAIVTNGKGTVSSANVTTLLGADATDAQTLLSAIAAL